MNIKIILIPVLLLLLVSCSKNEKEIFFVPDVVKWNDLKVEYIVSNDNLKLAYRQLVPKNPKKAIILIPGVTNYGYYYIPLMKMLYNKNILVRVIDLRGHGDSEGAKGDVPSKDSLMNDLRSHIKDIEKMVNGIEIFIGGHSMGAGICGRYSEYKKNNEIKGLIYISPLFHYRQSGFKKNEFVKINILKLLFGKEHDITHTYNPNGNDQKLVKKYTKIMSQATMVADYDKFKNDGSKKSLLIIGKNDELFEYGPLFKDFANNQGFKEIALENETHLGILLNPVLSDRIAEWMNE